MTKYIITNHTDLNDDQAFELVRKVIQMGRISNHHTQYAYETAFDEYHVHCEQTATGSDVFRIFKERKRK